MPEKQVRKVIKLNSIDGLETDIEELLKEHGLDLGDLGGDCKVVKVHRHIGDSLSELASSPRSDTVMVRVDPQTSGTLDRWVATGAVKSRSEAAALFIKEGLRVRASELTELGESLDELEEAKRKLERKAKKVLGDDD